MIEITCTEFFLRFYGLMMIFIGVANIISKHSRKSFIKTSKENIVLLGFVSLIIGVSTVILHTSWDGTWEITVTLLGWMSTIKGFFRILNLPQLNKAREDKTSESMLKKSSYVIILLGCVFIYGSL